MVRKRMNKIKKITGKLLLIPLSLTMGQQMAKASETLGSPGIKRKQKAPAMHEVVKISDGVYAGEGKTPAGEKIYFGMELMDETNDYQWDKYKKHAGLDMLDQGFGLVTGMVRHLSMNGNASVFQELSGFTDEEFKSYIDLLDANGFIGKSAKNREKKQALNEIRAGVAGLLGSRSGNNYIAYISKKPITGKFAFGDQPNSVNIKQFNVLYSDILMCVGVYEGNHVGKECYQNRGIFRNPASMVNNDYKGISLALHGFTAAAVQQAFQDKKYMTVKPIPAMHKLLSEKLQPGQMYMEYSKDNYTDGIMTLDNLKEVYINPKTKKAFPPIPKDIKILSDPDKEAAYLAEFQEKAQKLETVIEYGGERQHLIKIEALESFYKQL